MFLWGIALHNSRIVPIPISFRWVFPSCCLLPAMLYQGWWEFSHNRLPCGTNSDASTPCASDKECLYLTFVKSALKEPVQCFPAAEHSILEFHSTVFSYPSMLCSLWSAALRFWSTKIPQKSFLWDCRCQASSWQPFLCCCKGFILENSGAEALQRCSGEDRQWILFNWQFVFLGSCVQSIFSFIWPCELLHSTCIICWWGPVPLPSNGEPGLHLIAVTLPCELECV